MRVVKKSMRRFHVTVIVVLAVVSVSGCAPFAKVSYKKPRLDPAIVALAETSPVARAGLDSQQALKKYRKNPHEKLSIHVSAAQLSSERLAVKPSDQEALGVYNFAVARIVGEMDGLQKAGQNPWAKPITVMQGDREHALNFQMPKRKLWNPELYRMRPADEFRIRGIYVKERTIKPGLGAPVVAIPLRPMPEARSLFAPEKPYGGVTALLRFNSNQCELAFESPLLSETTLFQGRRFPLAADFSVPLAAMLVDPENNPRRLGFARYFNPGKYDETAQLARLDPWDENKTVVIVIHGLTDSQATWTPLINAARSEEFIRKNFQFWFFSYPSGYPYPYAAALLRTEMDAAFAKYRPKKPIVLIGHSMGGCISRLMITDVGEDLWKKIFGEPPSQSPISVQSRSMLEPALIFNHRPEVGRVIFLAAPLRGSEIAQISLGRFAAGLIRLPKKMISLGRDVLQFATFRDGDLKLRRLPNSVDTLAPNSRFVKIINTFPVVPGIPHHVIYGDRGRGDSPHSSDGVVPYWSSHMATAASEKAVPCGHGVHQHPEGIAEVLRILKLHAGKRNARQ